MTKKQTNNKERTRSGGRNPILYFKTMKTDTYKILIIRIKDTYSKEALEKLADKLDQFYNADLITAKELAKLDVKIMEKIAKL